MIATAPGDLRVVGREDRRFRFMPRFRGRELGLLGVVAVTLYVGAVSLGATERFRESLADGEGGPVDLSTPAEPGLLLTYVAALFVVHLAFVLSGRRTDQLLLPAVGLLGGIGLLLMIRLPQNLAGSLGEQPPPLLGEHFAAQQPVHHPGEDITAVDAAHGMRS